MSKRRREEEDSVETGNVDQGDFSDGSNESEEEDGKYSKYAMTEDDIEGLQNYFYSFIFLFRCFFRRIVLRCKITNLFDLLYD